MPHTLSQLGRNEGNITTTTATPQTILEIVAPRTGCMFLDIIAFARRSSNGDTKSWHLSATTKRDVGGAILLGGVLERVAPQGTVGSALWSITGDSNGDNMRLIVTGQAATTIDWSVVVDGWKLVQD